MQKADPELSVLPPSRGIPGEGAFLRDFPGCICYCVARNSQEVADMSRKPRVLHILSDVFFSGAENMVCQIVEMFRG